jgi:hypothetical protein
MMVNRKLPETTTISVVWEDGTCGTYVGTHAVSDGTERSSSASTIRAGRSGRREDGREKNERSQDRERDMEQLLS